MKSSPEKKGFGPVVFALLMTYIFLLGLATVDGLLDLGLLRPLFSI